jgi:hypothetical protein
VVGAQTSEVFTVIDNDPKPASLFGNVQSIETGATPDTTLDQQVSQSTAAGDWVTFGCWVRADGLTAAASDDAAFKLLSSGGADDVLVRFPPGSGTSIQIGVDWTFLYVQKQMTTSHTTLTARIATKGHPNKSFRFDEACMFVGRYKRLPAEPRRVVVRSRLRPPNTSNQIGAAGSLDYDSNADGVPDQWQKSGSFVPTLSRELAPANVAQGRASLKIVCNGDAGAHRLITEVRGAFESGDTWRASFQAKTSGTLTGTAPTLSLNTVPFDGAKQSGTPTSIGMTLGSFTTYTADLALLADVNQLKIVISFASTNGTLWIDDVRLTRV